MKKRNRLDKKQLNDLVYFQYNLRLRHNQLLNKRPDSDPIVLEDIDPTSNWVVESHPTEFDVKILLLQQLIYFTYLFSNKLFTKSFQ